MNVTGPMQAIEHTVTGAVPNTPCSDYLILSATIAGVADGSTAKPWEDPRGPDGATLAAAVSATLEGLDSDCTAAEAVNLTSSIVAGLHRDAGVLPGSGAAVTFAVIHAFRRQVWRIGDAHILVNGRQETEHPTGETIVAHARAMILRERLSRGLSVRELRINDVGRQAVEPLLRTLVSLRNRQVENLSYGAIDGTVVPTEFIEVMDLPTSRCEVVITTDGYPMVTTQFKTTEDALQSRLKADPLMIDETPATKGWRPGTLSYDDRTYLRVLLPALGDDTSVEGHYV
ncbi:MAG: hypothetical protein ACYDDU_18835 [Dermatophilaceae bacterium]